MREETLDEILDRLEQDFLEEQKKRASATSSDTEQFTELVQKYQRNRYDEER